MAKKQLQPSVPAGFARKRLRVELAARDPRWAELYEAAVLLLPSMQKAGSGYFLAHAARELTVAIVRGLTNRPHRSRKGKKKETDGILSTSTDEDKFSRIVAAAFDVSRDHLNVKTWVSLNKGFVKAAHVATGSAVVPIPKELVANFERLEQLMYGLLAPYFDTEDELDELAAITHPAKEDVKRLQPLLVRNIQRQRFFRRLTNIGWFDVLDSHGLLEPPKEPATALGENPELWYVWPEGDFVVTCARADSATQYKVASYLQKIPSSCPNPSFWTSAVRAAIELPASLVAPMVKTFKRVLCEHRAPIGADLVRLATKLATDGELDAAFVLAYEVFHVARQQVPSETERTWGPLAIIDRLDSYEVRNARERLLPILERLAPERALYFAKRSLDKTLVIECEVSATREITLEGREPTTELVQLSDKTYSEIWAKDLTDIDDDLASAKEFFAGMVTRIAREIVVKKTVPIERVLKAIDNSADVYRRIELLVLAEAGDQMPDRLSRALDSLTYEHGLHWDREFSRLIRQKWDSIPADARVRFLDRVAAGPSRDHVVRSMSYFSGVEPSEADLNERIREWQRDMLDLFGPDLPKNDTERIKQLRQELIWLASDRSDILAPKFPFFVGAGRHRLTPMAEEDFFLLPADHILQLCANWLGDQQSSATQQLTEEMAGATPLIAQYVEKMSISGESVARGLISLRYPHLVEAALEGLLNRNNDDAVVPWDIVLEMADTIARGNDEANPDTAVRVRTQRTWRDARYTVLHAIETAGRQHKIPVAVWDQVWQILRLIMQRVDTYNYPTEDHTCKVTSHGLQVPSGTLAFRGIHAAMAFARHTTEAYTLGKRPSITVRRRIERASRVTQPQLRELLELSRAVASEFSGRRSVDAAIGRLLPTIASIDSAWIKLVRPSMLRGNADADTAPAWSAFLSAYNYPDRRTVDLISASYSEMAETRRMKVEEADRHLHEASPDTGLIKQAFASAVTGNPSFGIRTKLFKRIVNRASGADLAAAYFSVSYGLRDSSVSGKKPRKRLIDDSIARRFIQLWRWRINSLKTLSDPSKRHTEAEGLCWLFLVDDLPEKMAVALMRQTVVLLSRRSQTARLAWGKLARMVGQAQNDVFAIACRLIDLELNEKHPHLLPSEHVYAILEHVVLHGSARSAVEARRLAHRLGEQGYSNLKSIAQHWSPSRKRV